MTRNIKFIEDRKMYRSVFTEEAISHQDDDTINRLADAIKIYRKLYAAEEENKDVDIVGKSVKSIRPGDRATLIENILNERFGYKKADILTVIVLETPIINARVIPTHVDRNHVLLNTQQQKYLRGKSLKQLLDKDIYSGTVDLERAVFYGDHIEMPAEIGVTYGLLFATNQDGYVITERGAAAMILHEMGHIGTLHEYMGYLIKANHVLEEAHRVIASIQTTKERVKVVNDVKEYLKINKMATEDIAELDGKEAFKIAVMSAKFKDVDSATSNVFYDNTTWEAMADQFVSRFGGAADLSDALIAMHSHYMAVETMSPVASIILRNIQLTFAIPLLPVIAVLIFSGVADVQSYDTLKDRVERFRREQINRLNSMELSKKDKQALINSIDAMAETSKGLNRSTSYLDDFFNFVVPSFRRQHKTKSEIQSYERFVNNELSIIKHIG